MTTFFRISQRVLDSKSSYNILKSCYDPDTIDYRECFKVMLLNRCNKVLGILHLTEGGIADVSIDTRLVFQAALLGNACGIIISHNHPSGNLKPSPQDNEITNRIKNAGQLLGINLLDHIIITSEHYYSYADEGKI